MDRECRNSSKKASYNHYYKTVLGSRLLVEYKQTYMHEQQENTGSVLIGTALVRYLPANPITLYDDLPFILRIRWRGNCD